MTSIKLLDDNDQSLVPGNLDTFEKTFYHLNTFYQLFSRSASLASLGLIINSMCRFPTIVWKSIKGLSRGWAKNINLLVMVYRPILTSPVFYR